MILGRKTSEEWVYEHKNLGKVSKNTKYIEDTLNFLSSKQLSMPEECTLKLCQQKATCHR